MSSENGQRNAIDRGHGPSPVAPATPPSCATAHEGRAPQRYSLAYLTLFGVSPLNWLGSKNLAMDLHGTAG